MSATVVRQPGGALSVTQLPLTAARVAAATLDDVLRLLDSSPDGLSSAEASARLIRFGPNAVRTHRVSAIAVLGRQLRSAVLGLLAVTAVVSFFLGDATQAIIIGVILAASIGLGFVNEYRAERASAALHSGVRHTAVVRRDGHFSRVDVTVLVPGDVIRLALGEVVPADVRLIDVNGLECNESILSGESTAAEKSTQPVKADAALTDSDDLAFMGTIVSAGEGTGMVYATGVDAQFGRIAAGLGERQPETEFQAGLRRFSYLLLWVAMTLTVLIFDHQPAAAPAGDRLGAVRAGDRGGDHAATAAGGGQHQPGDRIAAAGQAQGSGQTAGVHRGPRRHRRADHR